jgi:hypothetical protein
MQAFTQEKIASRHYRILFSAQPIEKATISAITEINFVPL